MIKLYDSQMFEQVIDFDGEATIQVNIEGYKAFKDTYPSPVILDLAQAFLNIRPYLNNPQELEVKVNGTTIVTAIEKKENK